MMASTIFFWSRVSAQDQQDDLWIAAQDHVLQIFYKNAVYFPEKLWNCRMLPVWEVLEDQRQLGLGSEALLKAAECYKQEDAAFIFGVLDGNFDSRVDAVDTIKAFVEARITDELSRMIVWPLALRAAPKLPSRPAWPS